MKNLNFGTKLLIILLGTVILSLGTMIFFTSKNQYANAEEEAKNYIKATVKAHAMEQKSILDNTISVVDSMVNRIETAIKTGEKLTKEGMVDYQKNILKKNDFLFTAWIGFDDDSYLFDRYDGKDVNPYYTPKGVFQPLVTSEGGGKYSVEFLPEFNKEDVYLKPAIENKRVSITKPYEYEMSNGKKVLMVSVAAPIIINSKVIGVVGVDFSLETINKKVSEITLYKTGYLSLYEPHGIVVAHPRTEGVGKPFSNLTSNPTVLGIIEQGVKGKEYDFMTKSLRDGKEAYTYSYPYEFGDTKRYWMMACSVPIDEFMEKANDVRNFSLIFSFIVLGLIIVIVVYNMRILSKNLTTISSGLLGFFAFLNKESGNTTAINIKSTDEFGTMAKVINENIVKTQELIKQDEILINDVKRVVDEVKAGYLNKRIEKTTVNTGLEELKNNFNEMLENSMNNICTDVNKVVEVLDKFSKLDFRVKIENDNGKVAKGINNLATIINDMLKENKANGLTLEQSSKLLLENVDKLNLSSNEAAASLEETAAALEEITSNIRNNTESIAKMSKISSNVTSSAKDGEVLANKTTVAMDEINVQVNLVNEAISVIDNIAFQTNILSLNAAVEAATAGEAGKGFAVVAQEVRNLASRSAEAAKEIKDIVEKATVKANEGKNIATTMIDGYKELNESISQTINLISDIEMSSKEQLSGIEQINDAVNELDRQTQQNAMVASQTNEIALNADEIAKLIVEDANAKEFNGKNEVKAKTLHNSVKKEEIEIVKRKVEINSKPKQIEKTSQPTIIKSSTKDDDEWESF
ncbi:methyl-accepting chemotaxis protein [Aliarcobacter lanthieri]|uniref:methyl-accepting chemotaxis protein n=1 Tax=Aliarcobacter lanthieri TaxID=1355374 RepID=UPI00155D9A3C|nr:methyl-accepting chemotaxis protein [Aliarcobacter lanthieri]QKF58907.1 Cache sensor-containing MCP-domain signal transduction protein [Aliarcobacter lanthieri]